MFWKLLGGLCFVLLSILLSTYLLRFGLTPEQLKELWLGSFGALAGAFGGALGAQWITDRAKRREEMEVEVRNCISAVSALYAANSRFLNMKTQQIAPLALQFGQQRLIVHEHATAVAAGERRPPAAVAVKFEGVDPSRVKLSRVEEIIQEKLSTGGRARALIITLTQEVETLDKLTADLNARMEEIRHMTSPDERVPALFGVPHPTSGDVDNRVTDTVNQLLIKVNDCLHCSKIVCQDLIEYGNGIRIRLRKSYAREAPRLPVIFWEKVEPDGPYPAMNDTYRSWETTFIKRLPSSTDRSFGRAIYGARKRVRRVLGGPSAKKRRRDAFKALVARRRINTPWMSKSD